MVAIDKYNSLPVFTNITKYHPNKREKKQKKTKSCQEYINVREQFYTKYIYIYTHVYIYASISYLYRQSNTYSGFHIKYNIWVTIPLHLQLHSYSFSITFLFNNGNSQITSSTYQYTSTYSAFHNGIDTSTEISLLILVRLSLKVMLFNMRSQSSFRMLFLVNFLCLKSAFAHLQCNKNLIFIFTL